MLIHEAFCPGGVLKNSFLQANDTMQGRSCLAACDQSCCLAEACKILLLLQQISQHMRQIRRHVAHTEHLIVFRSIHVRLLQLIHRQHNT